MTREEKQKAIDVLKNSAPVFPLKKSEEYNDYVQTLNKIMDWLEQETVSKESYDYEYFLRKEFEIKIVKLKQQVSVLDKIIAEISCNIIEDDTSGNTPARLRADWAAANKAHRIDIAILNKYKSEMEKVCQK